MNRARPAIISVLVSGAIAATLALATAQPVGATTPPGSEPPTTSRDDRVITVNGSGTVRVDPDTAVVNVGVQANAATGEEAMAQVNASSAALTEALVAAGIAEEDIQTSGISLFTTMDDRGEISGYQASLTVNVTIRDLDTVGATIDAAQNAAGPGFTIGGITFSFADPETVLEQARIDAVADARRTAEQYAAAAGVTLGDIVNITEHAATPPVIFQGQAEMAAADAAGPTISPGQLDLNVEITVSFAITA